MSRIIAGFYNKYTAHLVEVEDGRKFLVNTVDLKESVLHEDGYETAVFAWDFEKWRVKDWSGVFTRHYDNENEALKEHSLLCEELERYL